MREAPDTGFRTDTTRSATRTETPLRDIPQFINIVPQALIRSQNATTLSGRAAQRAGHLATRAAEGGTQANQVFFLRGFPLNQDIFIDGVRDLGEYNRDLFATESIEVLKGSVGADVRPRLDRRPHQPDEQGRRSAASAGKLRSRSARSTRSALTADVNLAPSDSSAVRLIALVENSGSYRYPQDVEKVGFAPSFWLNIGKATDLTLSYYYLKTKDVTDYGQPTLFTDAARLLRLRRRCRRASTTATRTTTSRTTRRTSPRASIEHQFSDDAQPAQHAALRELQARSRSRRSRTLSATDVNGAPVTRDDAARAAARDAQPRHRPHARQRRRRAHQPDRAHLEGWRPAR